MARTFAPLDGSNAAGEVEDVPAVVEVEVVAEVVPGAEPLGAGEVVLPTG